MGQLGLYKPHCLEPRTGMPTLSIIKLTADKAWLARSGYSRVNGKLDLDAPDHHGATTDVMAVCS